MEAGRSPKRIFAYCRDDVDRGSHHAVLVILFLAKDRKPG